MNPQRVPVPSRDGLRADKPPFVHAIFDVNPQRVPVPSRDGLQPTPRGRTRAGAPGADKPPFVHAIVP